VLAFVHRVQEEEDCLFAFEDGLKESLAVPGRLGKDTSEGFAPIVVAEQQMVGDAEPPEDVPQGAIGRFISAIGQVARENAKVDALALAIDVCDACFESSHGIETMQAVAVRNDVRVGDVYEAHGGRGKASKVYQSRRSINAP
jgi:hypothetical protein